MKLTKECLEAFWTWLPTYLKDRSSNTRVTQFYKENFHRKPLAEQWGVLQLFFDSVGIAIDIHPLMNYNEKSYTSVEMYFVYTHVLKSNKEHEDPKECKTREQAWEAAIEDANKKFNENYGK